MKTLYRLVLTAAAGYLFLPGAAWAGPVWSLQWEFGSNILVSDTGRSVVTFTPDHTTFGTFGKTAELADIGVASYLPPNRMDHITRQNYGALLKLTDLVSHMSRYFWFSGSLTGTISQHTSSLTNHFLTQTTFTNIHLGKNTYFLRIGPFISPTWANHFDGSVNAYVSYQIPVDPIPMPVGHSNTVTHSMALMGVMGGSQVGTLNPTPEPSGLLLGGMAMALAGVPVWWRRRRLGSS